MAYGSVNVPGHLTAADVEAVPSTRKVNNKPLSTDISLSAADVDADAAGSAAAVQNSLNAHAGNKSNPHGVTAAQIGAAAAEHTHDASDLPTASTSAYGATKLSSSVDSTSTSLAATPSAVKQAYDLANQALTAAGVAQETASEAASAANAASNAASNAQDTANAASNAASNAQNTANAAKKAADAAKAAVDSGAVGGGGGNILKITFASVFKGQTFIVSGGGETITGTVPEGSVVEVSVKNCNTTYTITSTADGEEYSDTVTTGPYFSQHSASLTASKIYGVCWNYGSTSTGLTRLTKATDPNKLVNTDVSGTPTPAVGTGSGSSPFDGLAPWSGMEEYNIVNNAIGPKQGGSGFSRTGQDTMVKIPEFGFKIIDDATNKKRYFYVSNKPRAGVCEKHPGSGKYVGRYNTINGNYSKSGAAPLVNITRATARSGAKGKGSKWSEYDYASWCAVWLLYLVEFADWDSQKKIGRGRVDGNSGAINSGGTDTMTYHTGRASGTDGKTAVQYRHVENPWGNVFEWIDGINFNERTAYICLDHTKYADDTATNYTAAGVTLPTEGYIKTLGQSPDFPWAFLPTGVGGSETTCIPDHLYSSTGWRMPIVGGGWDAASGAGLLYFDTNYASSWTYKNLGARLLFHPEYGSTGKIY